MFRCVRMLLATIATAAFLASSARAQAMPALSALPSLALSGDLSAPTFTLCPVTAERRQECLAPGSASGASAIAELRAAAQQPFVQRIVIFLPGYRTKMLDGHFTAQHLQDVLGRRFMLIHADWGSRGTAAGYHEDGAAAKRQVPALAALVTALHAALPGRELDILAHSMGARVAAGAMAMVKPASDGKAIVAQTVLAAPDLDLTDYEHAILRNPAPFGRVTIYASRHDHALFLSSVIHLHRRVGQLALWRRAVANTDVVDASAADPTAEGHGYAVHDAPVIRDIGAVFLDAPIPHPGWTRTSAAAIMWTLVPARVPETI